MLASEGNEIAIEAERLDRCVSCSRSDQSIFDARNVRRPEDPGGWAEPHAAKFLGAAAPNRGDELGVGVAR